MCGIVGYTGDKQAQPIVLDCMRKLEYRGYDSCGIAVSSGGITLYKDAGRVEALVKILPHISGSTGIGHTRWATHGSPNKTNAHPHLDCSGKIAVVHNGVIMNYQKLKKALIDEGHKFRSETDTEVIPHLVEKYYRGDIVEAVEKTLSELEGSYAIIAMVDGDPRLVAARKDSPMVVGLGDRSNFIASDVPALLDYTNRVIYLDDGDLAVVSPGNVVIRRDGVVIKRDEQKVLWSVAEAQKGGYEHFMLKEIHEQPRVIRNTVGEYAGKAAEQPVGLPSKVSSVLFLACGTSLNAAMVGKYIFEEVLNIPAHVELASEFNYYRRTPDYSMAIAISQSGETADTLRAMKKIKPTGCYILGITNVVGSSASRVASQTLYTRAGPEISVASTKAFTAQLVVLYLLAATSPKLEVRHSTQLLAGLRQLPSKVQQILDETAPIIECADYLKSHGNVFFIGRGINLPVALEGALKLKETSYIHAEGLAAGEIKHHTLAVLNADTPVIAAIGHDDTYEAMLTSIKEIRARGVPVIALAEEGDEVVEELADRVISVPVVDSLFSPVVNTVVLQLLAYYTSKARGCPIDFPRNLAKSVTVE
jgi:glucosamine--fructose-6-phosphate aminotransferase (isomerizing)